MFPYDTSMQPAGPVVQVRITDHRRSIQLPSFAALVDSGADCTCIPRPVLAQAPGLDYEFGPVQDYGGRQTVERFLRLPEATIELLDPNGSVCLTRRYSNLRLLVVAEGVVGRDILNQHLCELDGPGMLCRIR